MTDKAPQKHPTRGRRYCAAEKATILEDTEELGVKDAAEKHGCSIWSIYEWRRKAKREAAQDSTQVAQDPLESSDLTQQERQSLILEIWRQQPGLGPSQIRNQLKRKGMRASVNTVRAIMEEHGYVQPKTRRKEHTGRYEALRPFQLFHLDFAHFHVHRQKQCLLLIIDDFSRFIPGWTLLRSEHAEGVLAAFEDAVQRYGKPDAVMTDRGAAFHTWKGLSQFEKRLEEHGIDHYLSKQPQINGKAEALVATLRKELLTKVEFLDLSDAARQVKRWVAFYNYKRTHHALRRTPRPG